MVDHGTWWMFNGGYHLVFQCWWWVKRYSTKGPIYYHTISLYIAVGQKPVHTCTPDVTIAFPTMVGHRPLLKLMVDGLIHNHIMFFFNNANHNNHKQPQWYAMVMVFNHSVTRPTMATWPWKQWGLPRHCYQLESNPIDHQSTTTNHDNPCRKNTNYPPIINQPSRSQAYGPLTVPGMATTLDFLE